MKLIFIALTIFLTSCDAPREGLKDDPSQLYQRVRVVDARGPIGEDSITIVTFRSLDGSLLKLREKWPIETHQREIALMYQATSSAGKVEKSLVMTHDIEAVLMNSMRRRVASVLHIDPMIKESLREAWVKSKYGSFNHALLSMLIHMQKK